MDFLIDAFLFFLPAGLANMSPVFAARIPGVSRWDTPLDFGKSWRGKRIFGNNKTWRGLIFGTLTGGLTAWVVNRYLIAVPGDDLSVILIGCALGFGALLGDAVESFLKRGRGIAPGHSWFPFDQIDYIIGGLLFVYPLVHVPLALMGAILILYFGLHLLTSYVGFLLGFKSKPI